MNYNKQINVIFSKLILTIFVTFSAFNISFAADGDLDLSFNGNGKVITHIGDATDDAKASVIQPDGKIVVVGSSGCCGITGDNGFAVARYNVDGSLDNTFDGDGRVFTLSGIYGASANAVVIQSDGKIVVAGSSYSKSASFAVVRYNTNGSLDTSFGTDGKVLTGIGLNSEAKAIVIQDNGKIIVGGSSSDSSFNQTLAVARYNSDGTLDTTFDNDGIVTGTTFDCAFSIAIQSDGKIVAQSFSDVIRYNSNGSVDSSFGNNGRVAVGQYSIYKTRSLALQTDGKILATGYAQGGLSLFRFNTDGIADVSFAGDGSMLLQSGYLIQSNAITTQFDGKIVIAGAAANGVNVFRVNSNGSVDSSFGTNGVVTSYSDWVEIVSLIIQPDSKIVTTQSYRFDVPDRNFSVNRYNPDGSFDTSFGTDGKVITGEFTGFSNLSAVAVQPDGKIVAVGSTTISTYPSYKFDFAVARYNANGTLDTSFDQDGKIRTAVGNIGFDRAYAVAVQSDGKIVVAGSTEYRNNNNLAGGFAIVRYNQDGSLDNSFDGDGKMITEIPNRYFGSASSVLIQPDGKIVAAGTTSGTTVNQTIVRYNSDGSLDNTFGNNGVFIETDWKINDIVSLAIQSDGKFVTIGTAYTLVSIGISNVGFAVARYNSNGTPDNTFGVQGKVITPFGSSGQVKSLKIQTDGKIIAGGTSLGETLNTDPSDNTKQVFTIFRYNPDGNLDSTFDRDGKVYTSFEKNANLRSMAIQADNKIVAVGNTFTPDDNTLFTVVVRYMPDGSSDSTFDNDGKLTKGFNGKSAAIQPNGKIIVGGGMRSTFGLVRYQGTPIAANAGISGRITTASGRGIQNVSVQISGGNLAETRYVKTNAFGYYRFQDLQVGQNYVVGVSAKRYSFANPTRVITLNENLTGEDFVSNDK
jgi:uncharacterized delta-60 repeat protein